MQKIKHINKKMSSGKDNTTITRMLPLDLLQENEGQLFGLPANPRDIAPEKFEMLKADIQKYPQFLQYNALKVYPIGDGKYIVIGGNMRCRALKGLGYKEVPCIVIPKETPIEELKAYVILDNSGFGQWDWVKLSSDEWDAAQLREWGVDVPEEWDAKPDDYGEEFTLPDGDKKPFQQMTFVLTNEQAELIKSCINDVLGNIFGAFGNDNKKGNALYEIVRQWDEQRR